MASRQHTLPFTSPLLTIKETAAYLKLSAAYLYTLIGQKRLPVVKLGARTMLTRASLDEYIVQNTRPAAAVTATLKRGRPPKFPQRRKGQGGNPRVSPSA
jgi:excisionase family DNA binding protein